MVLLVFLQSLSVTSVLLLDESHHDMGVAGWYVIIAYVSSVIVIRYNLVRYDYAI